MQWENGGYFVLRPEIFDVLREGEDLVPHGFARLIPQGKLLAQRYTGFWRAADTFKDRAELEEMYRRGRLPVDALGPAARHAARSPRMPDPVPAGDRMLSLDLPRSAR